MTTATKQARLEARIEPPNRDLIAKAAALQGMPMSEFVRVTLLQRAKDVIDEHEHIMLSASDFQLFHDALRNPPDANAALRAAFAEAEVKR
jgi:uncharacterized protein (DUF1778 family)